MTDGESEKKCPGRLKSRPEFLAVQAGEKRRGGLFLLEVLDRKAPDTEARVGFTVTKRQGNAVERNRMRRKLREVVRQSVGPSMKAGHDYVIVARREVLGASFEQLSRQLLQRVETTAKPKQSHTGDRTGGTRSGNNARPRKK